MTTNCSIFRLQRPCILIKGALWFFLVVLFFAQQVGVLLAAELPQVVNASSPVVITLPTSGAR